MCTCPSLKIDDRYLCVVLQNGFVSSVGSIELPQHHMQSVFQCSGIPSEENVSDALPNLLNFKNLLARDDSSDQLTVPNRLPIPRLLVFCRTLLSFYWMRSTPTGIMPASTCWKQSPAFLTSVSLRFGLLLSEDVRGCLY